MQNIYIPILALFLLLSGCNDSNTQTDVSSNFATKAELLPLQSEPDILSDLNLINPILNKSNTEAIATRSSLSKAAQSDNKKGIKLLLSKSQQSLESTNKSLIALNLKSQEVQKIRVSIINGNMIAIKIHNIMLKDEKTAEDLKEINLLSKQSMTLQQNIGNELDSLNKKYNKN